MDTSRAPLAERAVDLTGTLLTPHRPDADDLLVVGSSLGTAVTPLWAACAAHLPDHCTVLGWDLPGHGRSRPVTDDFSVGDLARAVLALVAPHRRPGRRVWYAGVSLGGAVGLELALDPAADLAGVAVLCSAPRIGEPASWHERADLVGRAGTPVMVEGSAERWFAAGFLERDPGTATALLSSLQEADRHSYAAACRALARFDVRARLGEIRLPLLAVAGETDQVTPADGLEELASSVSRGRYAVIRGAAHLVPAEAPAQVASALARFCTSPDEE